MTIAISSHGTKVSRAPSATPTTFTEIAELGDLKLPELMRNEFDASVHNRNIDDYVLGIMRRNAFSFPLNFLPTNATHDHLTGLYKALIDNSIDGYKIVFPDVALTEWILSGQVQTIAPTAPVDGKLSADVTIRFSGPMVVGGVVVGL